MAKGQKAKQPVPPSLPLFDRCAKQLPMTKNQKANQPASDAKFTLLVYRFYRPKYGPSKAGPYFPAQSPVSSSGPRLQPAFAACNFTITAALNAAISGRNGGTGLDGQLMGFIKGRFFAVLLNRRFPADAKNQLQFVKPDCLHSQRETSPLKPLLKQSCF